MYEETQPDNYLTSSLARSLLRPEKQLVFKCADDERMWSRRRPSGDRRLFSGTVLEDLWDSVLMRCYDYYSGSQPDEDEDFRMMARDPRMRLDTNEIRKSTLTTHIDHAERKATPYISFTRCPSALQELAADRANTRPQRVVVVDPRTRIELGLPILSYSEEKEHYNLETRYTRDYWTNHFLCLWEVRPEEVVGDWAWDDLRSQPDWYESVIIPAVELHRVKRVNSNAQPTTLRQDSGSRVRFA